MKSWTSSCSAKSCLCLGMLIVGFEGEIMKLLEKMKKGKEQRVKLDGSSRKSLMISNIEKEMKKLECLTKYKVIKG